MILNDFTAPKEKFSREKLNTVLAELCSLVLQGQKDNPDFYGMVGAAVLDPRGYLVTGLNYPYGNHRIHAERAAIDRYEEEYGELPKGCIVITTLSPCNENNTAMAAERYSESCTDLLNEKRIKMAYCGYNDPTQDDKHNKFTVIVTDNAKIKTLCKKLADTFLKNNLAEETNKQILSYIKKIHPKGEFRIDHAVMNHAEWELTTVLLDNLHIDTDEVSPYDQINLVDYDHVKDITAQDIKAKPIVVDNKGWIIDGNHRAVAARDMGMTSIPAYVPVESEDDDQESYEQHMARVQHELGENFADGQNPGNQIREKLNAWMNQDQQYEDPSQRAGFQAKVWPYIQQNIKTILADKGEKGNGDYPAAPYAAWLLVQHMDAYPQNQIEFYNALKQAIPNHPKIQFLRDRAAVNQWIMKNANNPEYFIKGKALPNPTVNVRNPAMFKDAGIVATSREEALANAEQAGNKLLVAAVNATNAQTQPSYKQSANENFADGKGPGRPGDSVRHGIPKHATMAELEKASHAKGRKGQLARWQLNMRRGKKK